MNKLKMIVIVVLNSFVVFASSVYKLRSDVALENSTTLLTKSYNCEDVSPVLKSVKTLSEQKNNVSGYQKVTVVKWIDGDTPKVIFEDGTTNNIRLARVDCAETSLRAKLYKDCVLTKTLPSFQLNMGKLAKQTVESWGITNLWIMYDSTKNSDRWNRDLCWIYLNDKTNIYESLNYILLKQGLGRHDYKHIPYPTEKIKQAMDLAELEAKIIEPNDDQRFYDLQDVNKLINEALKFFVEQLEEIQELNEQNK